MFPENEKAMEKDKRMGKIMIDKTRPAPGDYDSTGAWKATKGKKDFKLGTEKLVNFTDVYKKSKKFVPGSSHYKYDVKKALSKLSTSPLSMRIYRH
jgi:hypothetical protein